MRNVTILLVVAAVMAWVVVPSQADTWDGGGADNHWNTDLNWTDNTKPTSSDSVGLSTDDFAELHGSALSNDFTMTGNATLDVYARADYLKSGSGGFELLGSGGDTGAWSVLTQHGGTMNLYWDMRLGYHSSSGDNIKTRGRYVISGGSLIIPRGATAGVAYGSYSDATCLGEFIVIGGDIDLIDIRGFTVDDSTHAGTGLRSKLEFQFDGDGDPIQQIDVAGNVTLGGILKITDDLGTTPDDEYILIEYTGTLTQSPGLDEQLPAGWIVNYGVDSDGDGNYEVTVAVPEPATMALLGLGGIGVLIRRKRR